MQTCAIVGLGRLGSTLAVAFEQVGWIVTALGRTDDLARAHDCHVIWITVPDSVIGSVARALAAVHPARGIRSTRAAVHTSGCLDSTILEPLQQHGLLIGSAHPLQTFPDVGHGLANLAGTSWALEGHPELIPQLETIVHTLGGRPWTIPTSSKPTYHAAAALACNGCVALLAQSLSLLEQCGLPGTAAREALLPLVSAAVAATCRLGAAHALTGPIARGDVSTIQRHLAALAATAPEIVTTYRALARTQLTLADLPESTRVQLEQLLT
jgi:predicted short-subunit dehydrogenase-like oxidoreductase (DUF2520 family)